MTTMEEQLCGFCQFPGSKTIGKKNIFSIFWFQEMSLKRQIFVNFLPQKFMTKYGIVSTYSVTFFSQKILAWEQYLQVYCNYQQDNWSELLPLAEFTYNNSPSATTGITPFFENKGYHPNITVVY